MANVVPALVRNRPSTRAAVMACASWRDDPALSNDMACRGTACGPTLTGVSTVIRQGPVLKEMEEVIQLGPEMGGRDEKASSACDFDFKLTV